MALNEIFCQNRAVSLLQRAFVADKVPHAYIFAGPEGIGKSKTAREWAKLLLCKNPIEDRGQKSEDRSQNRDEGRKTSISTGHPAVEHRASSIEYRADSCGSCESCRLFGADAHPDFNHIYKELLEFTRDGKGKKTPVEMPIDVIREFIIEKVSTRPTLSQGKVFVVSEAEKLNNSSQNCLLKVLEEPPEYCCIVLLCTRLEKLLPTTKSRCQIIRFGPVDEDRIFNKLESMGVERNRARYFARLAGGSMGMACQWAKLELADANLYRTKTEIVDFLIGFELAETIELAGKLLEKSRKIAAVWTDLEKATSKKDINRRAAKTLIRIIISALHDAMSMNVTPQKQAVNFDQKEQIEKLAGRLDPEQSAQKIADCYSLLRWFEANVNEKLIFEQLLFILAGSDTMSVR